MSRLADMVNLVTFLSANPGIPLRQAAAATNRSAKQLLKDLDRVLLVGLPPYDPGSYINVRLIGQQQEVHLLLSEHFSRPLTFAAQEAVALKYALEHFAPGADAESAGQVRELAQALGEALHGRARELLREKAPGFVTPPRTDRMRRMLGELTQACEARQVVELEYYSSHRAALGRRRVHPFELVEIGAHFYLFAFCELANATRHFRIDRIRSIRNTAARSTRKPPPRRKTGRMESLFEGKPKDKLVVRFSEQAAQEVADEWKGSPGAKVKPQKDGRAVLETPLFNHFWAIGYVMGFGEHAELLEPRWLRAELAQTIRKSLDAHA